MAKKFALFALRETPDDDYVAYLTPWSLVHFFSGAAAKQLSMPFTWFFVVHGAYEIKDQIVRETGDIYNSSVNSVGDQTVACLGHILAPHMGAASLLSKPFVLAFAASLIIGYTLEDTLPDLIG
jgi:hypothetical protein